MADRWTFYWRALGANNFAGWDGPGAPFPGFWRFRFNRKGIWIPAATWDRPDGAVACVIGDPKPSRDDCRGFDEIAGDAVKLWSASFIWAAPVREEQYRFAVQFGSWWDSLRAAANESAPGVIVTDIRQAEPIGPTPPTGAKR